MDTLFRSSQQLRGKFWKLQHKCSDILPGSRNPTPRCRSQTCFSLFTSFFLSGETQTLWVVTCWPSKWTPWGASWLPEPFVRGSNKEEKWQRGGMWVCLWMCLSLGCRKMKRNIWTQGCNISCRSQLALFVGCPPPPVFMQLVIRYEPAFLSYCMSPGCEWVPSNFLLTERLNRNRNF